MNKEWWIGILFMLAYISTNARGIGYTYPGQEDLKTVISFIDTIDQEAMEQPTEVVTSDKTPSNAAAEFEWIPAGKYASSFFSHWLDSWESMNVEYFLSHYSNEFNNGSTDFTGWAKNKRRLSKAKEYINVNATNVSLLRNAKDNIMAVTFYQDYKSNNFSDQSWKRQYWKKEPDQRWRIIYENEIDGPEVPLLMQLNH